jgi:hypothetical protein
MIHRDRLAEADENGTVAAVHGNVNQPYPSKDHADFIGRTTAKAVAGKGFRSMPG